MIARVSCRQKSQRIFRITQGCIEIDDGVKTAAAANPLVDRTSRCFTVRCIVKGATKGKERCAINPDAPGVGTIDHLFVRSDQIVRYFGCGLSALCLAHVIYPLKNNKPTHP